MTFTKNETAILLAHLDVTMSAMGGETVDQVLGDNMSVTDVQELAEATGKSVKTVRATLGSLTKKELVTPGDKNPETKRIEQWLTEAGVRAAFGLLADMEAPVSDVIENVADPKPKAAPKTRALKPHVYCQPVPKTENITSLTDGSKKHKLASALLDGATMEELMEAVGWNRSTVQSAFSYDMKNSGFGVERRKDQKYYLLMPKGLKRLPVMQKGQSRADALVAACN